MFWRLVAQLLYKLTPSYGLLCWANVPLFSCFEDRRLHPKELNGAGVFFKKLDFHALNYLNVDKYI